MQKKLPPFLKYWPFLFPILLILPGIGGFPYPSAEARYSDLSLTHYPYAIFLRQSLLKDHRFPLWSPLFFSGAPFAANPLAGAWYLPGWLSLLFPLPFGFNLLVIAHLIFGGIGLTRLLHKQGLGDFPAIFGGLAFAALPKFFAHYGAGHLTLLYAVPWTPWLLLSAHTNQTRSKVDFIFRPTCEPAVLAMIFLADPRWCVYAGLLWVGYRLFYQLRSSLGGEPMGFGVRLAALPQRIFWAAALSTPLLLPMVEFVHLSTRVQMQAADRLTFSLPAARLLGLMIPDFHGFHEYTLYLGQAVLLLALLGVVFCSSRKVIGFWMVVWLFSILLALGENLAPLRWISEVPGIAWLRVPARALFVSGLAVAVLAAHVLQILYQGSDEREKRWIRLIIVGYAGFILALLLGVWALSGAVRQNFAWAGILAAVCAFWIMQRLSGRGSRNVWITGLLIICFADLWMMNRSLFFSRASEQVLAETRPLAERVSALAEDDPFRIYSPSYSLAQQVVPGLNLELADGVDPLHLLSYADFMVAATRVPFHGYAVSVPPFLGGDPATDNSEFVPDARLLGLLNVTHVVSEFDIQNPDLVIEDQVAETRIYKNIKAMPRSWVHLSGEPASGATMKVGWIRWSPERIEVSAAGPGRLVLSEINYPGWKVWIDGKPASIEPFAGLLRSVKISTGSHLARFEYHPLSVYLGLGSGSIAWLLLGIVQWRAWRNDG